jgi:hypothetical protein
MPKRFPERFREPDLLCWSDFSGVAMAFGIVLVIGVVTGVVWIAWNLIRLYVLR